MVTPAARREAAAHLEQGYEMSERRACSLIGADRSSVRYRHRRPDDRELREVLRGAAEHTKKTVWRRIGSLLDQFTPQECENDIQDAGYGSM